MKVEAEVLCDWCGQPGTPENPIATHVTSPPVAGYEMEFGRYHESCAAQIADEETR